MAAEAGAGAHAPRQSTSDPADIMRLSTMWPAGTKCRIHSLQSAAGQQLNGLPVDVRGVDKTTGRLILRLNPGDEEAKWKKLKPENAAWEGIEFVSTGECASLVGEVRNLVQCAASSPGAVETALMDLLRAKLSEAQRKLPPQDWLALEGFTEQSRTHASQWLVYHELRVKPDLKLEGPHGLPSTADPNQKELVERAASTMKAAYWDTMREELDKPVPKYLLVYQRVEELVDTMAGFLPATRRAAFKERAVDLQMLRTQVDNAAFDFRSLADLTQRLGGALMELESPFQSALTKPWLDGLAAKPPPDDAGFRKDIVDIVSYLFEKCDILRLEVENFGLEYVRATKLCGLERDSFFRMMKTGILDMDVTKAWLAASGAGGHVEVAVIRGMACLLTGKDAIPVARCPEPLRCDLKCLQDFQSGLQSVALLGLVAITTTPFFPTDICPADARPLFEAVAAETQKLEPTLDKICEAVEQGILDLRHAKGLPPVDFEKFDIALSTLKNCLGGDVPLFLVLHKRACSAFAKALGPPKREIESNVLGESPWPLQYAVEHLNGLVEKVWTFLGDHLRVYGPVYKELLPAVTPDT